MPTLFVYGALMTHPYVLANGEAAYVDDHAVRFVVPGIPFLEPAMAALEPLPGARAWGVVADWTDEAWQRARSHEWGYDERPVNAITLHGNARTAAALFMKRTLKNERMPSARYATLLLRGAEHHRFPDDVVARYRDLVKTGPGLTLAMRNLFRR